VSLHRPVIDYNSTYPAMIAPRSEMSHSGELKPRIPTLWYGSRPSCSSKIWYTTL